MSSVQAVQNCKNHPVAAVLIQTDSVLAEALHTPNIVTESARLTEVDWLVQQFLICYGPTAEADKGTCPLEVYILEGKGSQPANKTDP